MQVRRFTYALVVASMIINAQIDRPKEKVNYMFDKMDQDNYKEL